MVLLDRVAQATNDAVLHPFPQRLLDRPWVGCVPIRADLFRPLSHHPSGTLEECSCRIQIMPYTPTAELVDFQRWVVRRADFMVPWEQFRKRELPSGTAATASRSSDAVSDRTGRGMRRHC
jgi:hypothetical protein